ncbi:hypothetical protein EJ05DRAFT_485908 [Pseudovirgaria hyperparasitica]|uniref:Vacuolar import and degradation protein-domain-containing protein n=1 Tax=Pseudovirgaria hyperparasitica TaxID=470096 RepID=A0A6A6W5E6_9PEZI|nr:uncharacterized protein EJ05DRAFT_485908 [Pseudovirgaria hyperparasitica]KAF2757823.1 hypothetical protein EJ05DRAFT_485908 [Pseudovirgaria hyperparasitica]
METAPMNRASSPVASRLEHRSSTPSYLTALRGLENPVSSSVLNIADTLTTTSAEDDVVADNVRFLRSPVDPQEEWRAENAREETTRDRQRTVLEHRAEERERRERMLMVMTRLDGLRRQDSSQSSYSDRVPSQNSLYDWSPANDEDELNALMQGLRQQQPTTNPEILRSMGRSHLESERQSQNRAYNTSRFLSSTQPSHSSESSLRATAIVQSVRRHPRFSDRSRHYMQRHTADREQAQRAAADNDMPARNSTFSPRIPAVTIPRDLSRYEQNRRSWQAEQTRTPDSQAESDRLRSSDSTTRPPVDSYRRTYLEDPIVKRKASPPTPSLQQTIRYLSGLRYCQSYEESLHCAAEAGFPTTNLAGDTVEVHNDFLLHLSCIPEPAETSWLRPGAVLGGHQHATSATSAPSTSARPPTISRLPNGNIVSDWLHVADDSTHPVSSTASSRPDWPAALHPNHTPWNTRNNDLPPHARRAVDPIARQISTASLSRQTAAANIARLHAPPLPTQSQDKDKLQDCWPVDVSIHAVDYKTHKISATMDAYNVPALPNAITGVRSPAHSITTYLEGEILNLRDIGFLTENFPSSAETDAVYWSKLPPFKDYTESELVERLTSKTWLRTTGEQFVFMRWKERCFVSRTTENNSPEWMTQDLTLPASRNWYQRRNITPNTNPAGSGYTTSYAPFPDGTEHCGLTISGFYYVSLRLSDGHVEGLYHDPQSSPYQHLTLESEKHGVGGAWGFR